jgi:hypothetical protein
VPLYFPADGGKIRATRFAGGSVTRNIIMEKGINTVKVYGVIIFAENLLSQQINIPDHQLRSKKNVSNAANRQERSEWHCKFHGFAGL